MAVILAPAVIHRLDMANMDGFEMARRLRQDTELGRVRLVALTSPPELHPAMRGWSIEFDGHIAKPVSEEALATLARHFRGGRQSNAAS